MASDGRFAWRPIEPAHAEDWAGLLAAIEAVDREDEQLTKQDLLEDFGDPDTDFARGSIAAWAEGTMVAPRSGGLAAVTR